VKKLKSSYIQWIKLLILIISPFVLWILPSDFFDHSTIILCPSRLLLDVECIGCGITRAVMHFHHWEFEIAAHYNQLVFIVYPILIYLWFSWLKKMANYLNINPFRKNNTRIKQSN